MLKKRTMGYGIIVLLLLPLSVFAQAQEMKDYKVIEGDTLWGISKVELNDPFLWPRVWKENPDIANPHRIYPDQMIRIPVYLIQSRKAAEAAVPEPAPVLPEPAVSDRERDKAVVKEVTPKPAPPSVCREPIAAPDDRYKDIKGIVLYDQTVVEGRILCLNAETVKIRMNDGKVASYSFIHEVENFIK